MEIAIVVVIYWCVKSSELIQFTYPYQSIVCRVVSIATVMISKKLLGGRGDDSGKALEAPFFITWFQAVFTIATILLLGQQKYAHGSPDFDFSINYGVLKLVSP